MDNAYSRAREALRSNAPLIQCLTNSVVMDVTANVVLAAGASPAMCDTPEEAGAFAQVAQGVLINAGTPSQESYAGMRAAIAGANSAGTPWVLDPVGAGALAYRTEFMLSILREKPAAIRGNASEIIALSGAGAGGRGVDSTDGVDAALPAALALGRRTGAVVAGSGERDLIVDVQGGSERAVYLHSGDPMLQLVIGTGCSLGALVAAYLAVWQDPFEAVLAAHAHMGAAGQVAASTCHAPGSFAVAWIDALYELDGQAIASSVRIEEIAQV